MRGNILTIFELGISQGSVIYTGAVGQSDAVKILLPVNKCTNLIAGYQI